MIKLKSHKKLRSEVKNLDFQCSVCLGISVTLLKIRDDGCYLLISKLFEKGVLVTDKRLFINFITTVILAILMY